MIIYQREKRNVQKEYSCPNFLRHVYLNSSLSLIFPASFRPRIAPCTTAAAHAAPAPVFDQGLSAIAATAFGTPKACAPPIAFRPVACLRVAAVFPFAFRGARVFGRPPKPPHLIAIIGHGLPCPGLLEPAFVQ